MTDSKQPRIISYGSRGNVSRYTLESPPPAAHISYAPEQVGERYGWVEIISSEKRWNETWSKAYVLTRCTSCGRTGWTLLGNLTRGLSKGCQRCSQPRRFPLWLDRRLTAAKQRCTNPNDAGYHRYGARGIEFRFNSVSEACEWLEKNLGIPDRSMELDRVDNDGHYEPGNLRWVTCAQNNRNKRTTRLKKWDPKEWPYSYNVVVRKVNQGLTREQILEDAREAVKQKRKNWQGIQAWFESMTS